MKLVFIRHADPDYEKDSLTEAGFKEAEALRERMNKMKVDYAYCSPLGRAKTTCEIAMKDKNLEVKTLQWLREFEGKAIHGDYGIGRAWDFKPKHWMVNDLFFDKDKWHTDADMLAIEDYQWVVNNFDALLEKHGYKRFKTFYKAEKANSDTIVLFCHFGVECVILSHIMNVSPMVLWHNLCAAPSSVSILNTEERDKGIANFRMASFGDVSHLYAAGLEPSFAARFCEMYTNFDERHHF